MSFGRIITIDTAVPVRASGTRARMASDRRVGLSVQKSVEPPEHAPIGLRGSGDVVAGAGVVEERVVRGREGEDLVPEVGILQRSLGGGAGGVHPSVESSVDGQTAAFALLRSPSEGNGP